MVPCRVNDTNLKPAPKPLMRKYIYPNYFGHPPTPQEELESQANYGRFESWFVGGIVGLSGLGAAWGNWHTIAGFFN